MALVPRALEAALVILGAVISFPLSLALRESVQGEREQKVGKKQWLPFHPETHHHHSHSARARALSLMLVLSLSLPLNTKQKRETKKGTLRQSLKPLGGGGSSSGSTNCGSLHAQTKALLRPALLMCTTGIGLGKRPPIQLSKGVRYIHKAAKSRAALCLGGHQNYSVACHATGSG